MNVFDWRLKRYIIIFINRWIMVEMSILKDAYKQIYLDEWMDKSGLQS